MPYRGGLGGPNLTWFGRNVTVDTASYRYSMIAVLNLKQSPNLFLWRLGHFSSINDCSS